MWKLNASLGSLLFVGWMRADAQAASASSTSASISSITFSSSSTEPSATHVSSASAPVASTTAVFPAPGSFPRDYSDESLERLWDLVGSVEAPPFTTTVEPQLPIVTPPAPSPLYPEFFAPRPANVLPDLKFKKDFLFGVASAAYQVEGAARDEGKGPTGWDWAGRQPGAISDNTTGDISDLHYFLYKEDVARVAAIGVNAHSFSISWARIFPFGAADSPLNQAGLDHYSDVIDYHLSMGVEPVVTLFHWDVPLALMAFYGGFTSPEIVDDFVNYAITVFKAYNGRVKTWYTFNEPRVYCPQVSGFPFNVSLAQGVNASSAPFHCAYNLVNAHVAAVRAFRALNISGEIAFKNDDFVGVPWRANSTEDQEAVERHASFGIGMFSDPVYASGDWPEVVKETVGDWLPRFTEEQIKENLGSADFFAIDPYRTQYVAAPPDGIEACASDPTHAFFPDCNVVMNFDSSAGGWAVGWTSDIGTPWLQGTPRLTREYFKELKRRWPFDKMYIAEYGFSEPLESSFTQLYQFKEDITRTTYFMTSLGETLLSIHEDKIPIAGAFSWAIMDNSEWGSGLSTRFGIQYVNYTTLERHYKRSAMALSEFFDAHGVFNAKTNSSAGAV